MSSYYHLYLDQRRAYRAWKKLREGHPDIVTESYDRHVPVHEEEKGCEIKFASRLFTLVRPAFLDPDMTR